MTIKYIECEPPKGEGYYLLVINGDNLEIALFGEGLGWLPIGSDYDQWQCSQDVEYQIKVVRKLDLEALANPEEDIRRRVAKGLDGWTIEDGRIDTFEACVKDVVAAILAEEHVK
jgi:hypothetical protein